MITPPNRLHSVVTGNGVPTRRTAEYFEAISRQLQTLENNADALVAATSAYTTSNVSTDRSFDANAAAGTISATPTQAEVENIRDAVLELSDVVGTLITDLKAKGLIT